VHIPALVQEASPCAPSVSLVTLSVPPSGSESLPSTSFEPTAPSLVVSVSSTASGERFVACVTSTAAVGPVGVTATPPASAVAWFKYVPVWDATRTLKCRSMVSPRGTVNGPVQVSFVSVIVGSAVVAPLVEPATYANPAGRVSSIDSSVTAPAAAFETDTV
jgi:hypothetical protein